MDGSVTAPEPAAAGGSARRRAVSVPALLVGAVVLTALIPVWLTLGLLVDAVRLRFRFPIVRLLAFGVGWAWLETLGVLGAAALWTVGKSGNHRLHYALQRWWATNLMRVLKVTTGIRVEAEGVEAFTPGPVVALCRHASLADSLVSAYVIIALADMRPRYVLKRELLFDPCLDIVGQRLPNHFLDRGATDTAPELQALTDLMAGLGERDCAVIFPEGTRANPAKRARALEKLGERDPARAERLSGLTTLLPPRPAGARAMLQGTPDADVVLCWHIGFDGLDTFGGILRHLSRPLRPIRFVARRVERSRLPDVDDSEAFTRWLDDRWVELDTAARAALDAPT